MGPRGYCDRCGQLIWAEHLYCGTVIPLEEDPERAHVVVRHATTRRHQRKGKATAFAKSMVRIDNVQHRTATVAPHEVAIPAAVLDELYAEADAWAGRWHYNWIPGDDYLRREY